MKLNIGPDQAELSSNLAPKSKVETKRKIQQLPQPVAGSSLFHPKPFYKTFPSAQQLDEIKKTIRETGQPELVPTIVWTKPDKKLEHRLIHPEISVRRKLRPDGDLVPCSLCSGKKPKCLSFYLLWSSDGHLRVVGNICGPKYFGESIFRDMRNFAKQEARKEAAQDYLLDQLPLIHIGINDLNLLEPVCINAKSATSEFRRNVPSLFSRLSDSMQKNEGNLVIIKKLDSSYDSPAGIRTSMSGGESEYEALKVAQIQGGEFLATSYNPVAKVAEIRSAILRFIKTKENQLSCEDALEYVVTLSDNEVIEEAKVLKSIHQKTLLLCDRLHKIRIFLSDSNMSELKIWGQHPENEFRFDFIQEKNFRRLRVSWEESYTIPPHNRFEVPKLEYLGTLKKSNDSTIA
ncbi:MAG: hypothetical protein RIM72_17510 [Alphaproteobacteria bacterium]